MVTNFARLDDKTSLQYVVLFLSVTKCKSPMHANRSTIDHEEEDELERDIEHLERRLAFAKSQLLTTYSPKTKLFKS